PYKMTALSLGEQALWIHQVFVNVGERVRVCIYSSDVSIPWNFKFQGFFVAL
ncbi:hypothetical protein HMPREF9096_01607, partial [Haemophilus sp. oral taxon 851 str. F0397]